LGYDFKRQRIVKKIRGRNRKSVQAMAGPPTTALPLARGLAASRHALAPAMRARRVALLP